MKFNLTYDHLKASEKKVFSQSNQDGILEAIFKELKIKKGVFCEIGARDGQDLSNTANLRINHGWTGLLMDAEPLSGIVKKEIVTNDNINSILFKHGISYLDLCCCDIDGIDPYIFLEMHPIAKVVCIEFNSKFKNDESYAIEYNENHKWDGDDYYSASLLALKKLGIKKGYTLVYVVDELDALFIRNDLIADDYEETPLDILFPQPIIAHEKISEKKWINI